MRSLILLKLFLYTAPALFFGFPPLSAVDFIEGTDIHLLQKQGPLVFECPKEANAIEINHQGKNLRILSCKVSEDLVVYLRKKEYNRGSIEGKMERTRSFLSLTGNKEGFLFGHGYFSHPEHILLQGLYISLNHSIFSPGSLVTLKPKNYHKANRINYIQFTPLDISLPIYLHGEVDLKNLLFMPCDDNNNLFMAFNAHMELSLEGND